ncbi:MAG TPA: ABC-2 family transporter protein [Chloroflexota bacterium]
MRSLSIATTLWLAGLRGAMAYRADFLLTMLFGFVKEATGFVLIWVILARFAAIAGWTLGDVAFLYGLRVTMHGLVGLGTGNIWDLESRVRQGEFDRYLVRPAPPLLQLLTERVPLSAFGELVGGPALFLAANRLVHVVWTPWTLLYLLVALIGGALLELAIRVLIVSFSFRALRVNGLMSIMDDFFSDFGTYPLGIFSVALQFVLTFGIPVAFMAYFPAAVLLGRTAALPVPSIIAYCAPLAGVLWMAMAIAVFQHEVRHYKSAGH